MSIIFWQHSLIFTLPSKYQRIKPSSGGAHSWFWCIAKQKFSLVLNVFLLGHETSRTKWTKMLRDLPLSLLLILGVVSSVIKLAQDTVPKCLLPLQVCEIVGIHALSPFFSQFAWECLWWPIVPEKAPESHRNTSQKKTKPSPTV